MIGFLILIVIFGLIGIIVSGICFIFKEKELIPLTADEAAIKAAKAKIDVDKLEIINEAKRQLDLSIYRGECINRIHKKILKEINRGKSSIACSDSEVDGDGYINDDTAKIICHHFESLGYEAKFDTTSWTNRWFKINWKQKS